MVTLLFITCLTASPAVCQERSMKFFGASPMTCMLSAQGELAKWAEMYPDHTISRWSCRSERLGERQG